jgi:hypothetical protein
MNFVETKPAPTFQFNANWAIVDDSGGVAAVFEDYEEAKRVKEKVYFNSIMRVIKIAVVDN